MPKVAMPKGSRPAKPAKLRIIPNRLRVLDRAPALDTILARAVELMLPVAIRLPTGSAPEDSAAIDLSLHTEAAATYDPPRPGVGYAGMTSAQRHAFLTWAEQPLAPAPPAFQQLYLAHQEVRLLESAEERSVTQRHLVQMSMEPAWYGNPWLSRAILLGFWLAQDGPTLTNWLSQGLAATETLTVALSLQAQLNMALTPQQLGIVLQTWRLTPTLPNADLLKLRLASLNSILGTDPLAHGLSQLDPATLTPQPWRTAHRDLRLALPQPDLRPTLEQLLRDMLIVDDLAPEAVTEGAAGDPDDEQNDPSWRLIVEFGHSRSEFFNHVLGQCQKLPGYTQIMDENRRLIYRVVFTKSELRRFWHIWDYINNWSTAHVYLNGNELEKWKIWPYSQYLR